MTFVIITLVTGFKSRRYSSHVNHIVNPTELVIFANPSSNTMVDNFLESIEYSSMYYQYQNLTITYRISFQRYILN